MKLAALASVGVTVGLSLKVRWTLVEGCVETRVRGTEEITKWPGEVGPVLVSFCLVAACTVESRAWCSSTWPFMGDAMSIGWQARVESLDVWTTLTLTVRQGQRDATPYSSVHNSAPRALNHLLPRASTISRQCFHSFTVQGKQMRNYFKKQINSSVTSQEFRC